MEVVQVIPHDDYKVVVYFVDGASPTPSRAVGDYPRDPWRRLDC